MTHKGEASKDGMDGMLRRCIRAELQAGEHGASPPVPVRQRQPVQPEERRQDAGYREPGRTGRKLQAQVFSPFAKCL